MLNFDLVAQSFRNKPSALNLSRLTPQPLTMRAQTNGGFDVLIYDIIGMGFCEADDVVEALSVAGGAPVRVRINSPGGDAFAGVACMNALNSYDGDVTVQIDGVAASAAAYMAMGADRVDMLPASFFMIHNSWTVSMGDKTRLQSQINALSRIDEMQATVFAEKTGLSTTQIAGMLDAETWLTAEEAREFGFADKIIGQDAEEVAAQAMRSETGENFTFEKRRKTLAARVLSSRY